MRNSIMTVGSLMLVLSATSAKAVWTNAEIGAEEDTYLGVQYSQFNFEQNDIPGDFAPSALVLRFGGVIDKYLAVEARVGAGIEGDSHTSTVNSVPVKLGMDFDYLFGLYAVGTLPITSLFDLHGVIGYTRARSTVDASVPDVTAAGKVWENDISLGLGASFKFDAAASLNLEYMSYMGKSSFDATALSIGITNRF